MPQMMPQMILAQITDPCFGHPQEYLYGVSLIVAAAVCFLLAGLLLFDSNNFLYTETPRYLRSRRLTGMSLAAFGLGFLLHWWFMPHFTNRLLASALSLSYFHIGGVLFSMSHTGLIDRHYFTRRVVVRDVTLMLLSLSVYWGSVVLSTPWLSYVGFALFFLHIGYLTVNFYRSFFRIYRQLYSYAEYLPNDTDKDVRWLLYSCHIIILFGIGSIALTLVFQRYTLPFTLLLFVSTIVFTYIYKALENFSVLASAAEGFLKSSEEYVQSEEAQQDRLQHTAAKDGADPASAPPAIVTEKLKQSIEQWVAERRYTDPSMSIKDALEQMGVSSQALTYYLENYTTVHAYRQWMSYLRVEEAKRILLKDPDTSLQTIADTCGYSNLSAFSRSFRTREGMSPSEWVAENRRKI